MSGKMLKTEQGLIILTRAWGCIFLVLAVLKILQFVNEPILQPKPDPVVGILTTREMLILVIAVELALSLFLLNWQNIQEIGVAMLAFVVPASLYHIGLIIQGDQHCSCLGVISNIASLDKTFAKLIARGLVVLIWLTCFVLLIAHVHLKKLKFLRQLLIPIILIKMAVLSSFEAEAAENSESIHFVGEYLEVTRYKGRTNQIQRRVEAWKDKNAVRLETNYEGIRTAFSNQGKALSTIYIDATNCLSLFDESAFSNRVVTLFKSDHAWQLGICGPSAETLMFLAINGVLLFTNSPGGVRPFCPPWIQIGTPHSLVFDARYRRHTNVTRLISIDGEIKVSDRIRDNKWLKSPLLDPGFERRNHLAEIKKDFRTLDIREASGFFKLSNFDMVSGFQIASNVWLAKKKRGSINQIEEAGQAQFEHEFSLRIIAIQPSQKTLSLFPVKGDRLCVSDRRLTLPELLVGDGYFETNILTDAATTEAAQLAFEAAVASARSARRSEQIQKTITVFLLTAAICGPLLLMVFVKNRKMQKSLE